MLTGIILVLVAVAMPALAATSQVVEKPLKIGIGTGKLGGALAEH